MKINKVEQLSIELAGGCNLACPMCPQADGREKDFLGALPFEVFTKAVDEALPLGLKFVNLGGSGEPMLYKKINEVVSYLTERNLESLIYTNGTYLTPEKFEKLCQSGLTTCKDSCQGYNRESYHKWMSKDQYDFIRANLKKCVDILKNNPNYTTELQTNHLIHDYDELEYQKNLYIENWIDYLGVTGEIWMTHNWSGQFESIPRHEIFESRERRSCGRPLTNVIEVRAGGIGKQKGAVVPCPNVLGQDSKAVMGHLDDSSLLEVINSEVFQDLRKAHLNKDFDRIDYCKGCDQLIETPEALVWTNIDNRAYGESRISNIDYVGTAKSVASSI